MSKTFTCCELIQALKDWQNNPKSKWTDKNKYFASEIFNKVGSYNDSYEFYCENCRAWFKEQAEKQRVLIAAQVEKEKAEGTFYSNPSTRKALEKFKKQSGEYQKNLAEDKSVLSFGKSPQE